MVGRVKKKNDLRQSDSFPQISFLKIYCTRKCKDILSFGVFSEIYCREDVAVTNQDFLANYFRVGNDF